MGMYTELIFGAELKEDTPKEITDTLQRMCYGDFSENTETKFEWIFQCGSYYFGVNQGLSKIWFDTISKTWRISARCNIKNYSKEIEAFLEWIKPHIASGSGANEMYAIVIYEEAEEPTIYYLNK